MCWVFLVLSSQGQECPPRSAPLFFLSISSCPSQKASEACHGTRFLLKTPLGVFWGLCGTAIPRTTATSMMLRRCHVSSPRTGWQKLNGVRSNVKTIIHGRASASSTAAGDVSAWSIHCTILHSVSRESMGLMSFVYFINMNSTLYDVPYSNAPLQERAVAKVMRVLSDYSSINRV